MPFTGRAQATFDLESILTEHSIIEDDLFLFEQIINDYYSFSLNDSLRENLLPIPGIDGTEARELSLREPHSSSFWQRLSEYLSDITTKLPAENDRIKISSRFIRSSAQDEDKYKGSNLKSVQRFNYTSPAFSGGLTFEKDPGESQWDDHAVGYLSISPPGSQYRVIAGDLRIQYGQGLVFSSGGMFSKGYNPIYPVKMRIQGIRGYLSTLENQGIRGAAALLNSKKYEFSVFAAKTPYDANGSAKSISSLYSSGYHRTALEIAKKNKVTESLVGFHSRFKTGNRSSLEFNGYSSRFSLPFIIEDSLRQYYNFTGNRQTAGSLSWDIYLKNTNLFGELAATDHSYGTIFGIIKEASGIKWSLVYRRYQPGFHNIHSGAFGSNRTENTNETGFYSGLSVRVSSRIKINTYFDLYETIWRTYYHPLPDRSADVMASLRYSVSTGHILNLDTKYRTSGILERYYSNAGNELETEIAENNFRFRINDAIRLSRSWRLTSRMEYSQYNAGDGTVPLLMEKTNGILFYGNIRYAPYRQLKFTARFTRYQSLRGECVFYEFEPDLPGFFQIAQLRGRGNKLFISVQYHLFKPLFLGMKYRFSTRKSETESRFAIQISAYR